MQTKKDITPFNEEGEPHGYWEIYYPSGKLWFKGNYVNGKQDGYWEWYHSNGKLMYKGNYVNDKKVGIWFDYAKELFYAN